MVYHQYYLPNLPIKTVLKLEEKEFKEYISAGSTKEQIKRIENMGLVYLESWEDETCNVPERIHIKGKTLEYDSAREKLRKHPSNPTSMAINHLRCLLVEDMNEGQGISSWPSFLSTEDKIITRHKYSYKPNSPHTLPGLSKRHSLN